MTAPKPTGRPPLHDERMEPHSIALTDEHVAIAKRLGETVSAGVRKALELAARKRNVK